MDIAEINDSNLMNEILQLKGRVAVVGMSPKPERDSYKVAKVLMDMGWTVIPVNPMVDEIMGAKSYGSLAEVPGKVDVVDVFRKSDEVPKIVDAAINKGVKYLWLQLGVVHEIAANRAREAGIGVIMDKCMKQEYENM
ncbi:CoA-binding protein [bacterium]|nr:CoA-binding protein [bacterium]